jgi:hypothetical protein
MYRWPVGEAAVGGALAFPVEEGGAEGEVAVAGGGGEEGFAFAQGDEEQVALAGFVPEHALAVDPGGVVGQHAEGRFDFGAAVVSVHARRQRQGPGHLQGLIGSRHWRISRSERACGSGGAGALERLEPTTARI